MFIAFVAFCAMIVPSGYINFRHQVKSHEVKFVGPKMGEDLHLKAKGIKLPGYNR